MILEIPEELRFDINLRLSNDSASCGPLIENAVLEPAILHIFEERRTRAYRLIAEATKADTKKPAIYFDFIDDPNVNARADCWELGRTYSVLCNTGSIKNMNILARAIFESSADIIPGIADFSAQHLVRRCCADLVEGMIFDFLICHEIGHLRNGHLDFMQSRGFFSIIENDDAHLNAEEKLTRQVLEWDADSHAIVHSVNAALTSTGRGIKPGTPDEFRQSINLIYGDTKQTTFAYLLSVYLFFRIFIDADFSWESAHASNYPPTTFRLISSLTLTFEHLRRCGVAVVSNETVIHHVVNKVEEALVAIDFSTTERSGQDLSTIGVVLAKQMPYHRLLEQHWSWLYPILDGMKFGGRLAPPEC